MEEKITLVWREESTDYELCETKVNLKDCLLIAASQMEYVNQDANPYDAPLLNHLLNQIKKAPSIDTAFQMPLGQILHSPHAKKLMTDTLQCSIADLLQRGLCDALKKQLSEIEHKESKT